MLRTIVFSLLGTFLLLAAPTARAAGSGYAGSSKCFVCHPTQYNLFRASGHPFKLQPAEQARNRQLPLPPGYTWDDISYVIGGAYKKSRYIDRNGYIITAAKDGGELKTQYNIETGTWSFYHKGEKKPYDCGRCHTTGYSKEGHQDGLEGLIGTWAEPGIQCEACHGPGAKHVKTKARSDIMVDRSAALCGRCHIRGSRETIPAKGGFIRHHEQYNELLAGAHAALDCVTCHDPHRKAAFSIRAACESCHAEQAAAYRGSPMESMGVGCVDCHMPRASKSAVKRGPHEGDIRTHLFRIDTRADGEMFYTKIEKGKKHDYARGAVTLDFACLGCHRTKNMAWAAAAARGIHGPGKTP